MPAPGRFALGIKWDNAYSQHYTKIQELEESVAASL